MTTLINLFDYEQEAKTKLPESFLRLHFGGRYRA